MRAFEAAVIDRHIASRDITSRHIAIHDFRLTQIRHLFHLDSRWYIHHRPDGEDRRRRRRVDGRPTDDSPWTKFDVTRAGASTT
jgi:hypothetical protein